MVLLNRMPVARKTVQTTAQYKIISSSSGVITSNNREKMGPLAFEKTLSCISSLLMGLIIRLIAVKNYDRNEVKLSLKRGTFLTLLSAKTKLYF